MKKLTSFKFEIKYSTLCFLVYFGIFAIQIQVVQGNIGFWLPLNGKLVYPFLPDLILNSRAYEIFRVIFLGSCLLCAFGMNRRLSSFLALGSGLFYFLLIYGTGKSGHRDHLTIWILCLFFIYENSKKYLTLQRFVFLCRLTFCLVFVTAGITKLLAFGTDWFQSDLLIKSLLRNRYMYSWTRSQADFDWNLFFINHYNQLKYLFYFTIPLEIFLFLALLKKFRFLVILLAAFQYFAAVVLYAVFIEFAPFYFFWLNINEDDNAKVKA